MKSSPENCPLAVKITVEPHVAAFSSNDIAYRVADKIRANCLGCGELYNTTVAVERAKQKTWHCRSCAYKGMQRGGNASLDVESLPQLGEFKFSEDTCALFREDGSRVPHAEVVTLPCRSCGRRYSTSEDMERHRKPKSQRFRCRPCRKLGWDEAEVRLNRTRTFLCLACDSEFSSTLNREVKDRPEHLRGLCKGCSTCSRKRRQRSQPDPGTVLQDLGEILVDWTSLSAYSSTSREELLTSVRFEALCSTCLKGYPTQISYERLKEHPGLCRSCASIAGVNLPGVREAISAKLKTHCQQNPPTQNYGRQIWTTDLSGNPIMLRSSFELRFVQHLNTRGLTWDYEPRSFPVQYQDDLGQIINASYWPDFYVRELDLWVEIKGYLFPNAEKKWISFVETNPTANKVMLFLSHLNILERGTNTLEGLCDL